MKKPDWAVGDVLQRYYDSANEIILLRSRIMIFVAIFVHLIFNYLDYLYYPSQATFFMNIRIVDSLYCLICFGLTFHKLAQKYISYLGVSLSIEIGAGMILMIYLADGATSRYYEGVNLTILGLLFVNGFYFWPNFFACLIQLILYAVACLANPQPLNLSSFLYANYFMSVTAGFVLLMTKYYADQHFKTFIKQEELKMSENKLAQTNAKLEQMYQYANEQSKRDLLTGLYNNATFKELFHKEFSHSKRYHTPLSLVFIDMDYFKNINDQYGHQMGDRVLQEVGKILLETCRESDVPVRYGGDEMVVILPGIPRQQAFHAAERIKDKINAISFKEQGGPEKVQSSIGLAEVLPKDASPETFLERVDKALYSAKQEGRNRVVQWEEIKDTNLAIKIPKTVPRHSGPEALFALRAMVEEHDLSRNWTSSPMQSLLLKMSRKYHLSPNEENDLEMAYLLKDIGNIIMPDVILLKTGKLDDSEKKLLQNHTLAGRDLILGISRDYHAIAEAVYHHHEKWDGSGYPQGLKGESIPLMARIVSILDVFSAMTSERPYRKAISHREAIDEIERQSSHHFDPHVVQDFLEALREEPIEQSKAA